MNRVIMSGRLSKEPDLKYVGSQNTAVTRFTMAVDRKFKGKDGKKETDFINFVAWGKTAEAIKQYVSKGNKFLVEGRLEISKWQDNDGNNRYNHDIVVDAFDFIESKSNGGGGAKPSDNYGSRSSNDMPPVEELNPDSGYDPDEGDIPF